MLTFFLLKLRVQEYDIRAGHGGYREPYLGSHKSSSLQDKSSSLPDLSRNVRRVRVCAVEHPVPRPTMWHNVASDSTGWAVSPRRCMSIGTNTSLTDASLPEVDLILAARLKRVSIRGHWLVISQFGVCCSCPPLATQYELFPICL